MRKALLLSTLLVLGVTSVASAHYDGYPHRHLPDGRVIYDSPPPQYDRRDEYGPPRRYYDDDRGYYEERRRPGFGIDIPGGPSIRIRP